MGWGLQKGRGYLFVMDKMAGESRRFHSRVDGMVDGGGGGGGESEECMCDNEGRQWTGQSASGQQQMRQQRSKQ